MPVQAPAALTVVLNENVGVPDPVIVQKVDWVSKVAPDPEVVDLRSVQSAVAVQIPPLPRPCAATVVSRRFVPPLV